MTEQEVFELQRESGNTTFYLVRKGIFYNAYGQGAFALARATGYQVTRKHRKAGDIEQAGFRLEQLPKVLSRINEAGGRMEPLTEGDDGVYAFSGIDGTPDEAMVKDAAMSKTAASPGSMDCPSRPYGYGAGAGPSRLDMVAEGASQGDGGVSQAWLVDAVLGFNLAASTPIEAMLFICTLQQKIKDSCQKNF